MFKAIIFDVDGTLSETEEIHRKAFNVAFEKVGLSWKWDRAAYRELLNTTGGKERIRSYVEEKEPGRLLNGGLDDFIRRTHKIKTDVYTAMIESNEAELRPGIRRVIQQSIAGGVRLAIATTTSRPNVDALLNSTIGTAGVDMFEVICCGDSVPKKKPAPDIYLLALEQLDLAGHECIAIEDSRNGLLSSAAAGIPTIVTPSVYSDDQTFAEAELVIKDVCFSSIERVFECAAGDR